MSPKKKCPVCGCKVALLALCQSRKSSPFKCVQCQSLLYSAYAGFFDVLDDFLIYAWSFVALMLLFFMPWYFALLIYFAGGFLFSAVYYFAPICVLKVHDSLR